MSSPGPVDDLLTPPRRPRIAAFATAVHPAPDAAVTLAELDALAAALGADVAVVHTLLPDPRDLPAALHAAVGSGHCVPTNWMIRRNDVAHFHRTAPARCAAALRKLADFTQQSTAELLARTDLQTAFSAARQVQASRADLIVSHHLQEPALHAWLAAEVLGLPRIAVVAPAPESVYAALLPLHAAQAGLVLGGSAAAAQALAARCGEATRHRIVAHHTDSGWQAALAGARALLAAGPASDAPARGPAAAFSPPPSLAAPTQPRPCRPFLVLGAERTGSNLLVDLLDRQPGVVCVDEVWNPRFLDEGVLPWPADTTGELAELLALRAADPAALHDRLLRAGAARGAAWTGFKLVYFHGAIDDRIVHHLARMDDLVVVHLLRRDRLARFVSHQRAAATDRWHTPGTAPAAPAPPQIVDVAAMLQDFAAGEAMEARYRAVFAAHRHLELDYEDLTADLTGTALRLCELFRREFTPLPPRSQKTGAAEPARAIANFGEVRAALSCTRWRHLLAPGTDR